MNTSGTNHKEVLNSEPDYIFRLAPYPMWIFDLDSLNFLAVNKEAIRLYGYKESEFLSLSIKDIRPPEDLPEFEAVINEARNRTESFKEGLYRHQKKNGDILDVQIKSNLITYQGKKAEIVTAIDLTERQQEQIRIKKQAEYLETIDKINDTLLKSRAWLPALEYCFKKIGETLNIDRISFFQNDPNETITSELIKWIGQTGKALKNNQYLENIPLSKFPLSVEPLRNGKNFSAIVSELPSSPTKNMLQEERIKSVLVAPVIVQNSFIGFIGMKDCTKERKWSVEELQLIKTLTTNLAHVITRDTIQTKLLDNEYKFRTLVQKSSDLIGIINEEGIYQYVNHSSTEILGISPNEFIGTNALDYVHPEDISIVHKAIQKVSHNNVVTIPPFRFSDVNGKWHWLETKLTNFFDDPIIAGIVTNSRVITLEIEWKIENDLINSISKAMGQPGSLKKCLNQALSELLNLSNICGAEVWIKSQDEKRLDLRAFKTRANEFQSFYDSAFKKKKFNLGEGLPGNVWANNNFVIWEIPDNKLFIREGSAIKVGFKSAIGLPIIYNGEFLGCFNLFSQQNKEQLKDLEKMLQNIGSKLGAVVKQKIIEDEYRNFFEISPDPHCILGYDGFLKKLNPGFGQLLGYEEAELLDRPISSFVLENDKEEAYKKIEGFIENQSSGSFTVRFVTKKGEIKWLAWTTSIIDEARIFIAVAKDITEQKLVERELKKTYNRLKKAQKIARLGYWTQNLNAKVGEWSEETYNIFGYTPKNFIPSLNNVIMAFHPEDRYLIEANPLENLIPGDVKSFEHRILHASGEVRWVHQEIFLKTDSEGNPIQMEGTIQDITERKENEEQLKISNERFHLAMRASNEMIWELDHAKALIFRGKGYDNVFKYNTSESHNIENSWYNKVHPADKERVWKTFQKALKDPGITYWKEEYRILGDQEGIFYFIDRCYILKDINGNAIRSIGSALDVTVSRQQFERIKLQNQNLREIAWQQSHVIRAPLVKIMGLIELVKEYEGGGKSYGEIFEMISTSAYELDKVIKEIAYKTDFIEKDSETNTTY